MLNLSRIQSELEKAKEKLRNVEETIQKVEGKSYSNGPVRYGGPKTEFHVDKTRNQITPDEPKIPRKRSIASAIDSRIQRVPSNDSFNSKRIVRNQREAVPGFKRQGGDARPQGVFARLSAAPVHQADEEEDDDFGKKPTLSSKVYTTATEVPTRQEVIAAQAKDEKSKERNKRMFGALVGTLQKFRKEETRVREREEKRLKVEKKLEEDAKREKEKLMQEKRELFLEKKRREVEIKRIEWSLNRVKEYEAWEADVIPLKNFIQTQAKPHIFYLPSVHNTKTLERLQHSQKIIEKMIEKRKTNLKDEIENSEKKAKKAAAEGAEVEESENIPEDNDENEQQMEVDFSENKNGENGFFKEDKESISQGVNEEPKESHENWKERDTDPKEGNEMSDDETKAELEKEETEEPVIAENNEAVNTNICETKLSEPASESSFSKNHNQEEEQQQTLNTLESELSRTNEDKQNYEYQSVDANCHSKDTVNAEVSEKIVEQNLTVSDSVKPDENVENNSEKHKEVKPSLSESAPKTEDVSEKKKDSNDEKSKKRNRTPEKSQSRKNSRRSRTPKRSRSPKNSSRSRRRRSSSRQRRRKSSSNSPVRKSRRSRSPVSRRSQRNFTSRKKSPSRRRKSSSRSSSSVSPKKKRSKTSSSSSSDSD